MKFDHNVKYFCMIRELFQYLSVELVNKYENDNKYMISIPNEKIRQIFCTTGIEYYEFEKLIQDIAQKLFEEGKYYLNVAIARDLEGQVSRINLYTKMPENIDINQEKHVIKIKNNIKILSTLKRKRLLHKLSGMNEYEIKNYNSGNELTYFSEKEKKDQYIILKIMKDMYIRNYTPEEVTTYYHNYRIIKTRIWQVKYVMNIVNKLNSAFEKIFHEKEIIKYEGISIEELSKYLTKLKEDEVSMLDISTQLMKLKEIL